MSMEFGGKVGFEGTRLWFNDRNGNPLFGILRADAARILDATPDEPFELSVMLPATGRGRITLEPGDLAQLRGLSHAIDQALST